MRWPFASKLEPRVARLTPEAAPACARIHAAYFARPWDAPEIERLLRDPATLADAAWDGRGDKTLGFAISRLVRPEAELLTIATAPSQRGRGVGRALLSAHLARLAAAGAREIFLEVDEANDPARRLYRAFGFVEVGRRPGYYPRKDGSAATALVLRAELS